MQHNQNHNLNSNTHNPVIMTNNLHGKFNQEHNNNIQHHVNNTQNNNNNDQLVSIPTKICDGLFMADQYIAQDTQWLQMNQVTHIINCAGKHCKNNTQLTNSNNPVNFLTYQWSENNIQNIIDQNVIGPAINFIEQAKKMGGSVLVHCMQSQSRPFCILAAYLMIRYQWNLFKTLQFLNSRKQDIQLQPTFFEQLTSLHQKLQEKGLIKSRNWIITDNMSDQEIILTNTFLNSRKKSVQTHNPNHKQNNQRDSRTKSINRNNKKVNFKNDIPIMHIYSPLTIIAQLNPKRPVNKSVEPKSRQSNLRNSRQKQRAQSVNLKGQQQLTGQSALIRPNVIKQANINNSINNNTLTSQASQKQKQSLLNQMNVTKKWAQLRQSWMKQKQKQNNQYSMNTQNQNSRKNYQQEKQMKQMKEYIRENNNVSQTQQSNSSMNLNNNNSNSIVSNNNVLKKQQKISDRIQQKLNLIKSGYQAKTNDMMKRRDHTPITGKKIKDSTSNNSNNNSTTDRIMSNSNIKSQNQMIINHGQVNKKQRQTFIVKKQKQIQPNNSSVNQLLSSNANNHNNNLLASNKGRQKQKQRPQTASITSYDAQDRMNQNFSAQQQSNYSNNSTILKSSVKQLGNKSVIIVKPNGQFANYTNYSNSEQQQKQRMSVNSKNNLDKNNSDSRNSLRKVSNSVNNNQNNYKENNKENKNYLINNEKYQQIQDYNNMSNKQNQRYSLNRQNIHPSSLNKDTKDKEKNSKFFRNDKNFTEMNLNNNSQKINNLNGIVKMRSSSTKPIRKDDLINSSIMKNSSYSGKGKWKF